MTYDGFRDVVLRGKWAIDWQKVRTSPIGTFNAYNFSKNQLTVRTQDQLDEDYLVGCVSLPMWFPPITIGGDRYIDAVYLTDANLMEAIARGADELWIIWTVSRKAVWRGGFVNEYFQIIETSGNGRLKLDIERIEASNAAIAAGGHGEFGASDQDRDVGSRGAVALPDQFQQRRLHRRCRARHCRCPCLVPRPWHPGSRRRAAGCSLLPSTRPCRADLRSAPPTPKLAPSKAMPPAHRSSCTQRCRSMTSTASSTCRSTPGA